MNQRTIAERADHLSRRRARCCRCSRCSILIQQTTYFRIDRKPASARRRLCVDRRLGRPVAADLLAGLATKGFWLQQREVRDLMDDESSRANRPEGLRLGLHRRRADRHRALPGRRILADDGARGDSRHPVARPRRGAAAVRDARAPRPPGGLSPMSYRPRPEFDQPTAESVERSRRTVIWFIPFVVIQQATTIFRHGARSPPGAGNRRLGVVTLTLLWMLLGLPFRWLSERDQAILNDERNRAISGDSARWGIAAMASSASP